MTTVMEPVAGAVDMVAAREMFRYPAETAVSRPALWERLAGAARVTVVSAPAGTGKTVLLRSWIGATGLARRAAWVPVGRDERDPRRFWVSVVGGLRHTAAGSELVREPTAAPDQDGWGRVERLLKDLARLPDRVWLVIDDVHELRSAEALAQLELLVLRAPDTLRLVLATRRDLRLGLHRLRLEGQLTEIRAADLRFTEDEMRDMLHAAGVRLPKPALARLHERTEGWAAGLWLAASSLAGHPDPERFVAQFSGSERTVAGYLLAEVLDRQSEQARQLLVRTSVCERITGELADLLTGGSGGERILQDLEEAGAFVVAVDARRSWFRYHPLFADLLQLELRCAEPADLASLHGAAAGWFAAHGYPVEAIRHAQAAQDWTMAARLLSDHFFGLVRDGQGAVADGLLAGFPAALHAADPRLARLTAVGNAPAPQPGEPALREPISRSEARVLRLLPTNLSGPEIAEQLSVSVTTVRTHIRRLYEKLGVHSRTEAVEQARTLGLFAAS